MILPLDSDLEPVIFKRHWEELQFDKRWQRAERVRCSEEPWYWFVNYVYTIQKDESSDGGRVERFPPYEYLRYILHCCFVEKNLALDKSRQLLLTWLMSGLYLWYIQYRPNEECVCQSKKEEVADSEIIKRSHFIWRNEPSWLAPFAKYSYCKLVIDEMNSKMVGIPSGADQIRSKNPTRVFIDEGGFFEGDFEECRTAALACCSDVKCVSTPNAGLWDDFIHDRIVA